MKPIGFAFVIAAVLAVLAIPGAQATDGQPLILGQDNTSSSTTSITFPCLLCRMSFGPSGLFVSTGERGFASVTGGSPAFSGFRQAGTVFSGTTEIGDAVDATSNDGNGVIARSFSGGAGVSGTGRFRGVIGTYGGPLTPPSCSAECAGVLGTAPSDGDGVRGTSVSGVGVRGSTTASGGTGVLAGAGEDGTALQVDGKSTFSRSGSLTIPAGSSTVTKTGISLDSQSLVLATLQQNRSGLWVQSAVPSASGSSFTIYLNHPANADTVVAWFVVN
jgi:hypothetical protein